MGATFSTLRSSVSGGEGHLRGQCRGRLSLGRRALSVTFTSWRLRNAGCSVFYINLFHHLTSIYGEATMSQTFRKCGTLPSRCEPSGRRDIAQIHS